MSVYFDHNSTTRLAEPALEAMLPFLQEQYGNASSRHDLGTVAREAVNQSREKVASLVGVQASQVIFTSGGTESNNTFINGMTSYLAPGKVLIGAIEHPCVVAPSRYLTRLGWSMDMIPVSVDGEIEMNRVPADTLSKNCLVSVMMANNETGVKQPVSEVATQVRNVGGWMHTDAIQAVGKIPVSFYDSGVHAMSISAHKIYGPKGIGALIVDKKLPIDAFIRGGGHEAGLRSGTENVASIVGFGVAAELAAETAMHYDARLASLRDKIECELISLGAVIHGCRSPRLANTSYFSIPGIQGETLVMELNKSGFAVASGSACSSHSTDLSATLNAMGVSEELAHGAVRLSLGLGNTIEECESFNAKLKVIVARLKGLVSLTV
jgi:cysteine desulfurase